MLYILLYFEQQPSISCLEPALAGTEAGAVERAELMDPYFLCPFLGPSFIVNRLLQQSQCPSAFCFRRFLHHLLLLLLLLVVVVVDVQFNQFYQLVTVVLGVPEELCQRLPSAASHDQPRRERRPAQIQMHLLRKGVQVQAPPQSMYLSI